MLPQPLQSSATIVITAQPEQDVARVLRGEVDVVEFTDALAVDPQSARRTARYFVNRVCIEAGGGGPLFGHASTPSTRISQAPAQQRGHDSTTRGRTLQQHGGGGSGGGGGGGGGSGGSGGGGNAGGRHRNERARSRDGSPAAPSAGRQGRSRAKFGGASGEAKHTHPKRIAPTAVRVGDEPRGGNIADLADDGEFPELSAVFNRGRNTAAAPRKATRTATTTAVVLQPSPGVPVPAATPPTTSSVDVAAVSSPLSSGASTSTRQTQANPQPAPSPSPLLSPSAVIRSPCSATSPTQADAAPAATEGDATPATTEGDATPATSEGSRPSTDSAKSHIRSQTQSQRIGQGAVDRSTAPTPRRVSLSPVTNTPGEGARRVTPFPRESEPTTSVAPVMSGRAAAAAALLVEMLRRRWVAPVLPVVHALVQLLAGAPRPRGDAGDFDTILVNPTDGALFATAVLRPLATLPGIADLVRIMPPHVARTCGVTTKASLDGKGTVTVLLTVASLIYQRPLCIFFCTRAAPQYWVSFSVQNKLFSLFYDNSYLLLCFNIMHNIQMLERQEVLLPG